MVFIWIIQLGWFFMPVGVANMAPVLMKHRWLKLAVPMDGGRHLWGKPLFGSHKTWRGLIVAIIFGELTFLLEYFLVQNLPSLHWLPVYPYEYFPLWFGGLMGAAAILADLLKSFFKRRIGIAPGASWFPFDQIDLWVGGLLVTNLFYHVDALTWVIVLSVGISVHILVNRIGYHLGLKSTPW